MYVRPENAIRRVRIRISKNNTQHNGQRKKYKRTNNDPQSIYIKLNTEGMYHVRSSLHNTPSNI
jgi:sugar-specific transcriptional regulator TrmB